MTKPTIKQLNRLQTEINRVNLAIKLCICPECGSKIIPFYDNGDKAEHMSGYNYIACEKNIKHYKDATTEDDGFDDN